MAQKEIAMIEKVEEKLSPEEEAKQKEKQELHNRLLRENPSKRLRLISIAHDDEEFDLVFDIPSVKTYQDMKQHASEGRESMANEVVIYDCLVHPEKSIVSQLIESYPALEDRIGGYVARLAGTSAPIKVSKLKKA